MSPTGDTKEAGLVARLFSFPVSRPCACGTNEWERNEANLLHRHAHARVEPTVALKQAKSHLVVTPMRVWNQRRASHAGRVYQGVTPMRVWNQRSQRA